MTCIPFYLMRTPAGRLSPSPVRGRWRLSPPSILPAPGHLCWFSPCCSSVRRSLQFFEVLSALICIFLLPQPHLTVVETQTESATQLRLFQVWQTGSRLPEGRRLLPAASPSSWRSAHSTGILAGGGVPGCGVGTEGEVVARGTLRDGPCALLTVFPHPWTKRLTFREGKRRMGRAMGRCVLFCLLSHLAERF